MINRIFKAGLLASSGGMFFVLLIAALKGMDYVPSGIWIVGLIGAVWALGLGLFIID